MIWSEEEIPEDLNSVARKIEIKEDGQSLTTSAKGSFGWL